MVLKQRWVALPIKCPDGQACVRMGNGVIHFESIACFFPCKQHPFLMTLGETFHVCILGRNDASWNNYFIPSFLKMTNATNRPACFISSDSNSCILS